jgi:pimeloyl-ACP methyl ester carboxylesterase
VGASTRSEALTEQASTEEEALGAARESRHALATGTEVFVREWGEPGLSPLLILHGGAHSSRNWAVVAALLSRDFHCIVPDARGHGQSSWSDAGDYSCESQVADLAALLEVMGIDRFAVAGHSMGGLNALRLAGSHPGRATALAMIDVGTEGRREAMAHVRREREAKAAFAKQAPAQGPPGFDVRLIEHVPTYCGDSAERRRLLKAAAVPFLVLRGERSRILSLEHAEQTAAHVGARVVEIPEAGHNVAAQNPKAVAAALKAHLG